MMEELLQRIERLEYHQKLIIDILVETDKAFTKLIVYKNLSKDEVREFHNLCENMNKKIEEQKAEGLLNFHPLLKEFSEKINRKLDVNETISACLRENLHAQLMSELKKYL